MKYFKLEYNSLNIKETGTQFQCENVEKIGDIQSNLFPLEGYIDFTFELPIPIMDLKAKSTTILNAIPINHRFLILKNYFIDFLKDFDIGKFQSWNIKVKHKKEYYDFYSLFILNFPIQKDIINFEESMFYTGKYSDYLFIGNDIKIKNYNDYINFQNIFKNRKDEYIKYKKISLNLSVINCDMFCISNFYFDGFYISENLKTEIQKQKFTGFIFKNIEELSNKIDVIY
jgi:hypothetical protein